MSGDGTSFYIYNKHIDGYQPIFDNILVGEIDQPLHIKIEKSKSIQSQSMIYPSNNNQVSNIPPIYGNRQMALTPLCYGYQNVPQPCSSQSGFPSIQQPFYNNNSYQSFSRNGGYFQNDVMNNHGQSPNFSYNFPQKDPIDASTSRGKHNECWLNTSADQSGKSYSSRYSSHINNRYDDSISVVSRSTSSHLNINQTNAEIREIDIVVDFTQIKNPHIECSYVQKNFFVTKASKEYNKVGIKQLDILLKINEIDLSELTQEQGERQIQRLVEGSFQFVELRVGRLSNSKELESIRNYVNSPALDSISTIPSSLSKNKENISPSIGSKTTDGTEIVSFLSGESDFDDIRMNLTLDTSLYNIIKAMMHQDSKLDRKTRTHCSVKYQNSFTGQQVIWWLLAYVKGLQSSKDAKALAQRFVSAKLIKCPLFGTKMQNFSENTLYTFGANLENHQRYLLEVQEVGDSESVSTQRTSDKSQESSNRSKKVTTAQVPPQQFIRNGSIRKSGKYASTI